MLLDWQKVKYEITKNMSQPIRTPQISKCHCGANAKTQTWDDYGEYIFRVICDNKHTLTRYCGTKHRAICRWNNRVIKVERDKKDKMRPVISRGQRIDNGEWVEGYAFETIPETERCFIISNKSPYNDEIELNGRVVLMMSDYNEVVPETVVLK